MNLQISQCFIDALFGCSYFVDKFQELQLETYKDLTQVQAILQQNKSIMADHPAILNEDNQKGNVICQREQKQQEKMLRGVDIEDVVSDISELLIHTYKETVYKETNAIFENKLNYMTIMEEIDSLKQSINKITQTTSFAAILGKTCATQQSLTPEKQQKMTMMEKFRKNEDGDASMLLDQDESSIDLVISRKNLAQDKLNGFSFMNSFINDNKMNPHDEEIINERINASISKVQSSIEDRISQVQKQFTRRIEQIMKTIKNLIQMINENQALASHSIDKNSATKPDKVQNIQIAQPNLKKVKNSGISSKSTIITPNNSYQYQQKSSESYNNHAGEKKIQEGLLNRGSKKLTSLFGLGKNTPFSK